MKKSLVLASVLALSASAFGAADSSINDLQYLPNAGTIFGSTQYSHLKFDGGKSNDLSQKVGYGIMDNLFVDIGLNYSHQDSGSSEFTGLGDIAANGRYRLSGDAANRFDLIGGVTVSPSKEEIDNDGGNNYSGGHTLKVGAEYGNKSNERQWSVGAYYTHLLEAKTEDTDLDETDKADAHGKLSLAANLLTRLGEKCFFKTFASVNFEQKYDVDSDSGDYENASNTLWNMGGEYQHLISNNLYVNVGASAYILGSSAAGTVMQYNVGASYQF